jgi:hypothetical protein
MMYYLSSVNSSCMYIDLLGTVAYLQIDLISFVISAHLSVYLHVSAQFQLDGFVSLREVMPGC